MSETGQEVLSFSTSQSKNLAIRPICLALDGLGQINVTEQDVLLPALVLWQPTIIFPMIVINREPRSSNLENTLHIYCKIAHLDFPHYSGHF